MSCSLRFVLDPTSWINARAFEAYPVILQNLKERAGSRSVLHSLASTAIRSLFWPRSPFFLFHSSCFLFSLALLTYPLGVLVCSLPPPPQFSRSSSFSLFPLPFSFSHMRGLRKSHDRGPSRLRPKRARPVGGRAARAGGEKMGAERREGGKECGSRRAEKQRRGEGGTEKRGASNGLLGGADDDLREHGEPKSGQGRVRTTAGARKRRGAATEKRTRQLQPLPPPPLKRHFPSPRPASPAPSAPPPLPVGARARSTPGTRPLLGPPRLGLEGQRRLRRVGARALSLLSRTWLIGMKISLTKKPMRPTAKKPTAVRRATLRNSRRSGFSHFLTRLRRREEEGGRKRCEGVGGSEAGGRRAARRSRPSAPGRRAVVPLPPDHGASSLSGRRDVAARAHRMLFLVKSLSWSATSMIADVPGALPGGGRAGGVGRDEWRTRNERRDGVCAKAPRSGRLRRSDRRAGGAPRGAGAQTDGARERERGTGKGEGAEPGWLAEGRDEGRDGASPAAPLSLAHVCERPLHLHPNP